MKIKCLLLGVVLLLQVLTVFSQNLKLVSKSVTTSQVELTEAKTDGLTAKAYIQNAGTKTMLVSARELSRELTTPDMTLFVCWGELCLNATPEMVFDPDTLEPGTDSEFKIELKNVENVGVSKATYRFFSNDPVDSTDVSFTFDVRPVGLEELRPGRYTNSFSASILSLYPNPTNSTTNFKYKINGNYRKACMKVFDIMGTQITNFNLENHEDALALNVKNYASGVYFLVLEVDGKVASTRKFHVE